MNFLPLFSEDGAIELSLIALIFVGSLSVLSVSELIKRSLFKDNEGVTTYKVFSGLMVIFAIYTGFMAYPTYYRNTLYEKMARSIAAMPLGGRIQISRVNILDKNTKLSMGDTLGFSSLARHL